MDLLATCAFGLEFVLKRELTALGYSPKTDRPGCISFQGGFDAVVRANFWLRSADRVLIRLAEFPCPDFDSLFETVKALPWSEWLPADAMFPVTGRSRKSVLTSVPAIQRTVKRAAVEGLRTAHQVSELPETGPKYALDIAILDDVATLTLDTTGPSLHKRGYRKKVGPAPIKETLAASMILLSVWTPERPFIDPFCGSGTLPIEAALIGTNTAPGMNRRFSCQSWPTLPREYWSEAIEEAVNSRINRELQIIGTDRDENSLELARLHARNAGVADQIHFQQKDFRDLRSKRQYGCIVTNPPYGERLDEERRLNELYREFPIVLQRLPTWSHFIITSMPLERIIQQRATRRRKLFNGRIECQYFQFLGPKPPESFGKEKGTQRSANIDESADSKNVDAPENDTSLMDRDGADDGGSQSAPSVLQDKSKMSPVFGGLNDKAQDQAELFLTRLRKRARHFRRYAKRGIFCYRLYERDVPELPFVVDVYHDKLHITEYERPHDRNLGQHGAWLELMKKTAAKAMDLPVQNVYLKSRQRQRGTQQYQKMNDQRSFQQVEEDGLTFLVNLSDYVDTGLFLDHRKTRKMVRSDAEGKRFLNLFAYTGSFSVYAAAGGASQTTTVDLSKNYLDWAQRNMKTNGFVGAQHCYEQRDVMAFIKHAISNNLQFDLAVVDPPTFSNSKQTTEDWEVQSRHAELLLELRRILASNAVVYFSTNYRRFKIDEPSLSSVYRILNISKQTVPDDFRNKRIHQCWKLTAFDH